jgi:hypothetical protein
MIRDITYCDGFAKDTVQLIFIQKSKKKRLFHFVKNQNQFYIWITTTNSTQQKSLCKKIRDSLMITTDISRPNGMLNLRAVLKI